MYKNLHKIKHNGQFRYSRVRPVGCEEGAKMSRHKLTAKGVYAFGIKCSDIGKIIYVSRSIVFFYFHAISSSH
jgi:hypothetical protein